MNWKRGSRSALCVIRRPSVPSVNRRTEGSDMTISNKADTHSHIESLNGNPHAPIGLQRREEATLPFLLDVRHLFAFEEGHDGEEC